MSTRGSRGTDSAGAKVGVVLAGGLLVVGLLTARSRLMKPEKPEKPAGSTTVTAATQTTAAEPASPAPNAAGKAEDGRKPEPTQADRTALVEAVTAGELDTVKTLRAKGTPITGTLAAAAKSGNADLVSFLLAEGLDVHEDEDVAAPPLVLADDHPAVVSVLLAKGAKEVSLPKAARAGASKAVARLLAKGKSPNEKNDEGEPALQLAIKDVAGAKRRATVDALLAAGADVNAKNDDDTALGLALASAHGEDDTEKPEDRASAVVTKLVAKGAKVDGDALISALGAAPERRMALLDALLAGKLTREATIVAIDRAATSHDVEGIKRLATKPVAWNALDPHTTTPPLQDAIIASDVAVVKALLEAGAPTEKISEDGDSALLAAITAAAGESEDALRVVRTLLEKGASPGKRGKDGRTPLFVAAEQGSEVLVALLISKGARPDDAVDGLTPLDTADLHGHAGVVKLLKARGAHASKPTRP